MPDKTTSRITWPGHAAFRIDTSEGKVLTIDPWLEGTRRLVGRGLTRS